MTKCTTANRRYRLTVANLFCPTDTEHFYCDRLLQRIN